MVERRTWVNIAVRPCLHSFLTHNKHHLFENKVWEIYIKKCIRSFVEVVIISWLCFRVYLYTHSIQCNKSNRRTNSFWLFFFSKKLSAGFYRCNYLHINNINKITKEKMYFGVIVTVAELKFQPRLPIFILFVYLFIWLYEFLLKIN